MYEYEDVKTANRLEYDKLLQQYQVLLAAQYTVPLAVFFSVSTLLGVSLSNVVILNVSDADLLKITVSILSSLVVYGFFEKRVQLVLNYLDTIQNNLIKAEKLILEKRRNFYESLENKNKTRKK